MSDDSGELIDALRLSDQESQALMKEMDRSAHLPAGADKRRGKRLPYNSVRGLVLQVSHPGGTTARFLVKPRNISANGLSVLHGGFVHPGTPCSVPLRDLKGAATRIEGKVVSCRLVRGRVHELGIQLASTLPLNQYVLDPELGDAPGPVALPTLEGRILIVDEWPDDRQLVSYDLRKLGLEIVEADGGADAIHKLKHGHFDAAMVGEWLGDLTAEGFAASVRASGCTTPMIGVFAVIDPVAVQQAVAAGLATVVEKPYRLERVAQLLMQYLAMTGAATARNTATPDLSEKWVEHGMRPMILSFLQGLEIRLGDLQRQVEDADGSDPVQTCLRLKGAAASFGFPRISEAADELARLLTYHAPLESIKPAFDELGELASTALHVAEREVNAG